DLDPLTHSVDDTLGSLDRDDQPAFAERSIVLQGDGFARITHICSGFGRPAPPIDKAANGYLELVVGFNQDGLDPVVSGTATGCKEQPSTSQLLASGQLGMFVGDRATAAQLLANPVLVQLASFSFAVDGVPIVDGGFDFQLCRGATGTCVPGYLEYRLAL